MGRTPSTAASRVDAALADSRSERPETRRLAPARMAGLLQRGTASPEDQGRVAARFFELFQDDDLKLARLAMDAAAAAGASFDEDVAASMIGRLATIGANPERPHANDALRALRALEDNIGPHRSD